MKMIITLHALNNQYMNYMLLVIIMVDWVVDIILLLLKTEVNGMTTMIVL
jgi:hypothetical protein